MGEVLTKEQVLAAGTHPGRTPCYEMDLSEYVGQSIGEDTPKHVMFFKSPEAIGGGIAYGYYEQRGGWIVNPNLRGAAFKLIRRIQEQAAVTTKTFLAQRDKINALEQQLKAASQEFYIIQ
ncbi:MAG: hypothetical protein CMH98_03625, partial [Oceanospirillaceae bacterium]|nr:hypothetical protein [Oceanospirillaceae bacterium]